MFKFFSRLQTSILHRVRPRAMQHPMLKPDNLSEELKRLNISAPSAANIDTVIYHAGCFDGFGSAFAAWKHLGSRAEYIPATHKLRDSPPPLRQKNVLVVDYAFSRQATERLLEHNTVLVLDHHKSAMEELRGVKNTYFDMSKSGVRLAWEYFHHNKPLPRFLAHIEDRDLWTWKLPYTKDFMAAFAMVPQTFEEYDRHLDDGVVNDTIQRGRVVAEYQDSVMKRSAKKAVRKKFMGYQVNVINSMVWLSEMGNELAKDSCDFSLLWFYNHADRVHEISLRTVHDSIDLSIIAAQFGGGGHPKAAGFRWPQNIEALLAITDRNFSFSSKEGAKPSSRQLKK